MLWSWTFFVRTLGHWPQTAVVKERHAGAWERKRRVRRNASIIQVVGTLDVDSILHWCMVLVVSFKHRPVLALPNHQNSLTSSMLFEPKFSMTTKSTLLSDCCFNPSLDLSFSRWHSSWRVSRRVVFPVWNLAHGPLNL